MTGMTPVTDTTAADRAGIEQIIAGRTLADALAATVERYGDRPAYSDKVSTGSTTVTAEWRTFTWQQMYDAARDVAAALVDLGVEPGRTVAIMATNRIEHLVADMGAVLAGAVPMSIYNTLSPEQIAFIAGQSRPAAVFVETADHLDRWRTALTSGADVLAVVGIADAMTDDPRFVDWGAFVARGHDAPKEAVDARTAALTPHDPVTILYTSGTTGDPKGVVLSHRNVLFDCEAGLRIIGLERSIRSVSYLPYAHIAERILSLYNPQHYGDSHMYLVADPSLLLGALERGAPRGVLRRSAGLGEDPVRPFRAARAGARRRQEGSGRSRHAGRRRVRRVAPGRPHDVTRAPGAGTTQRTRPCSARSRRCSVSTRWSGPRPPPRRCRSTWRASSPVSGSRSTTSGA